jgi:hypothetical protein
MKRLLSVAGLFAAAVFAFSMVASMKSFDALYDIKPDSGLGKSKCLPCHATVKGGKVLNAYGKDLQSVMKAKGTKKLTEDILRGVEKIDSDKDGMNNVDEIKADRNPGEK